MPPPAESAGRVAAVSPAAVVIRGLFSSVQVNVNAQGNNVLGDAANEPTITVDATNRSRMTIAWRQFTTVNDSFRQAGVAHTADFGATWNMQVLQPGQFRSDPVLASDSNGTFYFSSLSTASSAEVFRSYDGGATWLGPVVAHGGDKQWITVDRTGGIGDGNIYQIWNALFSCCGTTDFTRSIDGALSFQPPRAMPLPKLKWGTLDVGPQGTLYVAGSSIDQTQHLFLSSSNAQNPAVTPTFSSVSTINLGGVTRSGAGPNPGGLLGQVWIAADHSNGSLRGNIYVLGSVDPPGEDPLDVMFIRSTDGGATWSQPVRINDDPPFPSAWQWFGTMSVAPSGRIDVVWNDTRNDEFATYSELYHSSSIDGGLTWSANTPITPPFNHFVGYPNQNKIGDYYHMVSDAGGANLAFAATFNGEQDVYYVRIPGDCNLNGIEDENEIAKNPSLDCSDNGLLDACEPDCNGNEAADSCDIHFQLSDDCTQNGVPDECERDCDHDQQADVCEIQLNPLLDRNDNRLLDSCEAILRVRPQATGVGNGLTWADAHNSLHAALGHAARLTGIVSEIWVAQGVYLSSGGPRDGTLQLADGVEVFGGFVGNEVSRDQRNWHRYPTILSCDILGDDLLNAGNRSDNCYHVVSCEDCGTAALDGFVVTAGTADGLAVHQEGAGLSVSSGQVQVRNCAFIDNIAGNRGGAAVVSLGAAEFTNCLFAGNFAFEGSALYLYRSSDVSMNLCTVAQNHASVGAVASDFGASTLASDGCIFWGNTDSSGSVEDAQITALGGLTINYSTVEGWSGQYGGTGNSGQNPLFADPDGADEIAGTSDDDFRLSAGSPAIDTGNPSPAGLPPGDLDGHTRVLCGRVDQGAFEFGIGDYDCGQDTDLIDVKALADCLSGPTISVGAACLAFDYDADLDVDLIDYALLQTSWPD